MPRVIVFGSKGPMTCPGAGGVERGIQRVLPWLRRWGVSEVVYARGEALGWMRRDRILYRQVGFLDRKNHAFWTHSLAALLDYLRYRRPSDVIHIHCVQNSFLCPIFRLLGHRVVFHLHGQEWRAAKWGGLMSLFMKASILPMLLFSHHIVTVCQQSRELLQDRYPRLGRKIVLVPNPVPAAALAPCPCDRRAVLARWGLKPRGYFLYTGRLVHHKRVDRIVAAMRRIPEPVQLVIAGSVSHSSDYLERLRAMARELGLESRVHFAGQLGWEDLVHLYTGCRAVILPSDTEGCSNSLLEAMALSCCIICSDLPENRSILKDAGLLVPAGEPAALQEAMLAVLDDAVVAVSQERCKRRKREWPGAEEIARRFLHLYQPGAV